MGDSLSLTDVGLVKSFVVDSISLLLLLQLDPWLIGVASELGAKLYADSCLMASELLSSLIGGVEQLPPYPVAPCVVELVVMYL